MTSSQLQDLIVAMLVRRANGTGRRWRMVVGPVRVLDITTYPHCNWSVSPTGGTREVGEVERLLDSVRLEHPVVTEG